jgi:anti-anti-sigma regulatory factor
MIKINLSGEENIFTRNTISSFFERINNEKEKEIVLDFKGVKFISRSCADEYLKQKENVKKKIIEVNMSQEVCLMFNAVKKQYKKAGFTISFDICSNPGKSIPA